MKGLIIGGDARFPLLREALAKKGHGFFPLAMEKVLEEEGPADYMGAECVILPLPVLRGGKLNAPLSAGEHSVEEFLEHLKPGTVVWAGMAGEELSAFCRERALVLKDYFRSEALAQKNALLTAEGALALMLSADGKCLCGRRVLISGFGRIGRLLAPRLRSLGAKVCVAARSEDDRVLAEAMGMESRKTDQCRGQWDFVVNTVPAVIFGAEELEDFGQAQLIELASPPYGFDMAAAEALGKKVNIAAALPSRFAPQSAAEAIMEVILEE